MAKTGYKKKKFRLKRLMRKQILHQHNNWSGARKEYGHVAYREKQGKEQITNIKKKINIQPKKKPQCYMTILLTHTSQWLERGTTRRQQDATAD
jgi:hypothetical protein